jgi:large subunit ribosomal protein L17
MKSLAVSLVLNEKIKTTDAKARELRPFVEKMITIGKKATLAQRRALVAQIGAESAEKIVKTLGPKYEKRAGGYTRIVKLPARVSDGSLMAIVEFV